MFNVLMKEKLNKVDDMFSSIDSISDDVEIFKMNFFVFKDEKLSKFFYVFMDESKKSIFMISVKSEFLESAFFSDYFYSSDEDFKMIGVFFIDFLFSKVNIDEKGTGEELILVSSRFYDSEGENFVEKIDMSGLKSLSF